MYEMQNADTTVSYGHKEDRGPLKGNLKLKISKLLKLKHRGETTKTVKTWNKQHKARREFFCKNSRNEDVNFYM